ncbi:MAG: polymerase sigma factor SigH, partial [Planctomycetota bacterium]
DAPPPALPETLPLLERVEAGDARAKDDLFRHYRAFILRLVQKKTAGIALTGSEHEDLVQKALIGLLGYRELFVPGRESELRAVAVQIVSSRIADEARYWNARKRAAKLDADETVGGQAAPSGATPSRIASRSEFVDRLRQCIARLPEQQRQVLVLRIQQRMSAEAVAAQLGKSPEAIGMIEQRARKALRECMQAHGVSPSMIVG